MKPSYEAIVIARKPCEGSCIDNVIKYGVGGINIDECRVPTDDVLTHGGNLGVNSGDTRTGKALGMFQEGTPNTFEQNPNGRFPANVILTYDETDYEEVCGGMPDTKTGDVKPYKTNSEREGIYYFAKSFDYKTGTYFGDSGSAARYFYNAQVTDRDQEQIIYEVTKMENQENQSIHLYSEGKSYKLYQGNMLDMLDVVDPNSIDAIVTDPPYELNFMNKGWDNSGIAFQKETWEKCLKVLKPGGYLLAFGGSRTFHRIACAIEDAGFEIRDTIMYLYGSGFPKSMNIGLAIDKKNGVDSEIGGVKPGHQDFVNRTTDGDTRFENGMEGFDRPWMHDEEKREAYHYEKLPTSDEAKKWAGWGTQLKPAYESITVARKPCEGSCVDNVLKYGVGGINIDGCRIPLESDYVYKECNRHSRTNNVFTDDTSGFKSEDNHTAVADPNGRFPSNVILTYDDTDFDEVCGGMPDTKSNGGSGEASKVNTFSNTYNGGWGHEKDCANLGGLGDEGSAARYFMRCNYNNRDEVNLWEHLFVNNAETNLQILNTQRELFVQQDVGQLLSDMKFHYVKYAENLSVLIETPIVHDIAKILIWDFRIETSQVIQDFIINSKKCTQFQNLVQFVENLDNIDTTPTTQNLLKLFGYVKVVITNYILGNIEFDQKRYIYSPKASKRDRDEGLPNGQHNIHPTLKPVSLMQYLIRLVTPKGGTVLDPFNGSGSTGKACMWENKERSANYKYIGIELTPEYLPISKARIDYVEQADSIQELEIKSKSSGKPTTNTFTGIKLFDIPQG